MHLYLIIKCIFEFISFDKARSLYFNCFQIMNKFWKINVQLFVSQRKIHHKPSFNNLIIISNFMYVFAYISYIHNRSKKHIESKVQMCQTHNRCSVKIFENWRSVMQWDQVFAWGIIPKFRVQIYLGRMFSKPCFTFIKQRKLLNFLFDA